MRCTQLYSIRLLFLYSCHYSEKQLAKFCRTKCDLGNFVKFLIVMNHHYQKIFLRILLLHKCLETEYKHVMAGQNLPGKKKLFEYLLTTSQESKEQFLYLFVHWDHHIRPKLCRVCFQIDFRFVVCSRYLISSYWVN